MTDFIELVKQMRDLQKEYFKTKNYLLLNDCKALEKQVDDYIKRETEPEEQKELF